MEQPTGHSVRASNLPVQGTPFIGRDKELAEIANLLADPACRLLTLIGAGGIGKTRLAIQVASEVEDAFGDGAHFVALQPLRSADFLVSAVADALDFALRGQGDPTTQLVSYVCDRQILLVLDNFEHLLAPPPSPFETEPSLSFSLPESLPEGGIKGGLDLLTDILACAPGVKLLITSREILNLQEEWLYQVQGLPYPDTSLNGSLNEAEIQAYGAVQLFLERARRVRRDFSLADDGADVIRICQLVEGMPLAIELAASWTRTMPCAQIADEIQHNLDFLSTGLRNVPDRQRSMRAIFDQSWQLLNQQERDVFKRLSVFRGSFDRDAAGQVASASLATLSALVDKSLLRADSDGRYQIHELLRQYAAVQLAQSPDDIARVYDLHCAYYADFLHERQEDMVGGQQREATVEIRAELANIRAAWGWMVGMSKVEEIRKSTQTLSWFYQFQSRYLEGADAFDKVADSLMAEEDPTRQANLALAEILVERAWFYIRLGRLEQAEAVIDQCRAIYCQLDVPPVPGQATDPLLPLGIIASIKGNYAEAARLGEEARARSEAHNHLGNLPFALYVLVRAALGQGDLEAAQRYAQQACAIVEETGDRWFMAYCLLELGNVASALFDYAEAKKHYQTSYAIRQEFEDPEGMAVALNHLGKLAITQENYPEAQQLYQQSLALYQEINDRGGLATSLNGLGVTDDARGDYQASRRHFRQALQIAADMHFVPLTLSIIIGIGELMLRTGQEERGIELLALTRHHPASDHEIKDRAQMCLNHFQEKLEPERFAVVTQRGQAGNLETVSAALLTELLHLEPVPEVGVPAGSRPVAPTDQPLVEPLTPRELEVLYLIADGLTNQQIADELIISVGTAKYYTSQIYGKLNVNSRTQAVARARELSMLS